jgi:hypothetical protein
VSGRYEGVPCPAPAEHRSCAAETDGQQRPAGRFGHDGDAGFARADRAGGREADEAEGVDRAEGPAAAADLVREIADELERGVLLGGVVVVRRGQQVQGRDQVALVEGGEQVAEVEAQQAGGVAIVQRQDQVLVACFLAVEGADAQEVGVGDRLGLQERVVIIVEGV